MNGFDLIAALLLAADDALEGPPSSRATPLPRETSDVAGQAVGS